MRYFLISARSVAAGCGLIIGDQLTVCAASISVARSDASDCFEVKLDL